MAYDNLQQVFENMCTVFDASAANGENALVAFDISGENGGKYWTRIQNGTCEVNAGDAPAEPDMVLSASSEDYLDMINGTLNPMTGFMMGKIKVKGNMGMAMKLQQWFKM